MGAGASSKVGSGTGDQRVAVGDVKPTQLVDNRQSEAAKLAVDSVVELKTDAKPVKLDFDKVKEFQGLPQGNSVIVEYVWIDSEYTDGKGFDLCSKSLTVESSGLPLALSDLPVWAYSGGADGADVQLVPRRIYKDPFRRGANVMVLADTYDEPSLGNGAERVGAPTSFNTRHACERSMQSVLAKGEEPWFGIEQEYYFLDLETDWPLGWPPGKFPGQHDMYYCSVGATKAVGRDVVEAHYKACLYAGVKLGGVNSEVAPAQWEFQVGPCTGIDAADDLWMARYILQRLCELFHIGVTFDPKPVPGWPGIGCHTNYSTKATRALDGLQVMEQHMELLQRRHFDHMAVYGRGNRRRLQGEDSTAKIGEFTWGIGDRSSSVRIGARVAARGCGYYEDRRPASNMDPYEVTRLLVETTLLSAKPVRFAMPSKSFSAGCSPSGPEEPTPEGGEAGTACASCADGMADIAAAPDGCEQVLPYSMAEGREAWA